MAGKSQRFTYGAIARPHIPVLAARVAAKSHHSLLASATWVVAVVRPRILDVSSRNVIVYLISKQYSRPFWGTVFLFQISLAGRPGHCRVF